MLEQYNIETNEEQNRLVVVRAALEIAKSAAGAASANVHSIRVADILKGVAQEIDGLADAIESALKK